MSESRTNLATPSTAHPHHHPSHHPIHHTSLIATHTPLPSTTHAASSSTAAGPTSFSYPTPSNTPHSSGVIMGLSLGIAFCILFLCAAGLALFYQRRSAKGKYEERVIRSVYGSDDETLAAGSGDGSTDKEKKHRTWMGRKIVALVPGNQYGREGFV